MIESVELDQIGATHCAAREALPDILGKFLNSEGALASLEDSTIKFTPPNQLNDEFDCIPSCYRDEAIEKVWYHSSVSRLFPEQKKYLVDTYKNKKDWASLREQLSDNIGVASFADLRNCDLPLMWNRYGDRHMGCLIIFCTDSFESLYRVKYSEKRPEISIPIGEDSYPRDEVLSVLTTKERGTRNHWEKNVNGECLAS